MRLFPAYSILIAAISGGLLRYSTSVRAEEWPAWRGPRADGSSLEKNAPAEWNAANVVWKTALPGKGHASAITWGNRVYTVTALPEKLDRVVLSLDRATGKIVWQQTVVHGPLEKIHPENSYASGTPATDGKRIYVTFRVGDEIVVAAHDLADGKQVWSVRPGTHVGEWGFSTEPVLFKDKVIVDGDSKGKSFLIALSRDDGRTLWRVDRSHQGISYSAPLIREMAGRLQLVQCGDRCVTSFDPETGKPLWTVDGPSQEFAATPTYSERTGLVYASSSWPQSHLVAIKPDGNGDVTHTHVVWDDKKGAPYIPSMIFAGEFLLTVNPGGTAYCYEAATGNVLWQERLGRHHASPVLLGGLVYFINDDGQINVIKPGRSSSASPNTNWVSNATPRPLSAKDRSSCGALTISFALKNGHARMSLIALSDVTLGFRGPPILEGANLAIEPGERVCLLGRNGAGKTTLLRLLQAGVEPDRGEVIRQQGLRTAMLPQQVPQDLEGTVFDEVSRGFGPKAELLARYHHLASRLGHHVPMVGEESGELQAELGRIQHAPGGRRRLAHAPADRGRRLADEPPAGRRRGDAFRRHEAPHAAGQGRGRQPRSPAPGRADQPPRYRRHPLAGGFSAYVTAARCCS